MADSKITALREKVACFGDRQAPFRSWLTDLRQTAVSPYAHFHMHKIRIIPALKVLQNELNKNTRYIHVFLYGSILMIL